MGMDDREARERVEHVEALLGEIEELSDPAAREQCTDVIAALLDLYGEGLARIVERSPEPGALADDELVAHLLLVHGIHPVPLEARVISALEEVRPYLQSHGGNVELVSLHDGVVRLRLEGSCSGCPSSAATLSLAVEEAIRKAAPEIEGIEAEEEKLPSPAKAANGSAAGPALIQLQPIATRENRAGAWATAGVLPQLRSGGTVVKEVSGEAVLFCEVDGTPYAYRPDCPACAASLESAELHGAELQCAGCGHRFDARLAGRCTDAPDLHLEPVPLLVDDAGLMKVALAPAL
jgi:Fe-S cluster biogenesis protein NfuA/nitrite reductase/ring-hydroxylating ferredoxin subunit